MDDRQSLRSIFFSIAQDVRDQVNWERRLKAPARETWGVKDGSFGDVLCSYGDTPISGIPKSSLEWAMRSLLKTDTTTPKEILKPFIAPVKQALKNKK